MLLKAILLFIVMLGKCFADDDVLIQINKRLANTEITQGGFQQEKQLKFLRNKLISQGFFVYHQSKGVIWKTLTPVPSLVIVNDSRLLTAQGEQSVPAAFGKLFKALLGSDFTQLMDSFSITGTNQTAIWQIRLEPKDEMLKKIFSKILLSGDTELRLLELYELNGNITHTKFDRIIHPLRLTKEQESEFERLSP